MSIKLISAENVSKSCRICLDNDHPTDLIRPCLCKGGSAYVHRNCLDKWRSLNKSGRGFEFCDVCRFQYRIEPVIDNPSADQKRLIIFRLLVTRDITLIILLIQVLLIAFTFMLQAADKNNQAITDLYPSSMSSFGVYYLTSVILFLAILGFFGLIGICCGWISRSDTDECDCFCLSCWFCCGNSNQSGASNGCDCGSGGDCDCKCNGGGGGEGIIGLLIVVVVIFAIIGVFVGVICSVIIFKKIVKRHTKKLWLRQEAKKYVVKDFEGKIQELENLSNRRPITRPSIENAIQNDENPIKPSAPTQHRF